MTSNQDSGSLTAETMIAIPVVILVLLLGVAAGRVTVAEAAVQAAARDASRQASIARTAGSARSAATAEAINSLRNRRLACASVSVQLEMSGFSAPVGRPATVSVTVRCTVLLSDLGFPGMPGTVVKTSTSMSPLDPYRSRALGIIATPGQSGAL